MPQETAVCVSRWRRTPESNHRRREEREKTAVREYFCTRIIALQEDAKGKISKKSLLKNSSTEDQASISSFRGLVGMVDIIVQTPKGDITTKSIVQTTGERCENRRERQS